MKRQRGGDNPTRTRSNNSVKTRQRKQQDVSSIVDQAVEHSNQDVPEKPEYDGNIEMITSTGSTLLDQAILGEQIRGGGIPAGILVEIFGKNQSGKTVLLCEIAGNVQRKGGQVMFKDPEARLNKRFSRTFGLEPDAIDYSNPDKVPEVFKPVRDWKPDNPNAVNGIFADSLAALSTELELTKEKGDKMGMRRAKEFSQECRKTCRTITKKNYLMVCSNQMRATGNSFGPSEAATGGNAIPYYASLRIGLQFKEQLSREREVDTGRKDSKGAVIKADVEGKFGIEVEAYIVKSSVGIPYRKAPLYIVFKYGIDDVRANLQWYKTNTKDSKYFAGGRGLEEACHIVEKKGMVTELREAVIDLWERIDDVLSQEERNRMPKERW